MKNITFDGSSGDRPYAKKHKAAPAQIKQAKTLVNSWSNFMYQGVFSRVVSRFLPYYYIFASIWLLLKPFLADVSSLFSSSANGIECSS